ncbi:secretin N-terminal domain-containing protein [Duganella violaceipulchra]|uniref:General secretion pathway protein D n=1 Tax=Duganella violaceipulchra TaxID=2849652 RepID=A0AA41HAU4_9BURK|nr:secretin N-terminal domain-containing protein [Duganella violaceicalia]MBV6323970.1 general secretion pathway protein GspD [Duganella violaceicalia]MCP2011048.1 general secretion pathway protein D [Duganella violaceicalia]
MTKNRFIDGLAMLGLVAVLGGCGGSQAYRQGQALLAQGKEQQGLAKLNEATVLDPANPEYRIAYASRRNAIVNRLIANAEAERRDEHAANADILYRRVLEVDGSNVMARQGLETLAVQRRHRQVVSEAQALFANGTPGDLPAVLEMLRPVLSEDPAQKGALALKQRVDALRASTQRPEAKLAVAHQKPITLEFRDMPLKLVFDAIAQASGLNFFFDSDVRQDQRITVLAKNTSIDDAIHLLLTTNQLRQKVLNGNSLLIYPSLPQKIKDYQPMVVRSFFLANVDAKTAANAIKTIVKTQDIVVDERLGTIVIRDTPEAVRMAERIVALQDMSDPEVMLEVEVMEIQRSRLLELGVKWPSQLSLAPSAAADSASLTLAELRRVNSSTLLATVGPTIINARKEDQDGSVLANPRIRVRNKEKAKIMIGDRVPAITTTSTSLSVTESVNYLDVGLKLEVEPTIYLDDEVAIKVNLEVSNIVRQLVSKSGTTSYQIGSRSASTVLRLKNGETEILAGLISDEDRSTANKVPGIGELPIVGRLFGSKNDDSQRSEILLSITPRVVRSLRRPDLMSAEFEAGTDSSMGARPLTLSTPVVPTAHPAAPPAPLPMVPPTPIPVAPAGAPTLAAPAPSASDSTQ